MILIYSLVTKILRNYVTMLIQSFAKLQIGWLSLSINVKKTHVVIFKAKNKNLTNNISINTGNQNIEQVNSTNFLGLNNDQDLSFVSFLFYALKIMKGVFFTWKHLTKVSSKIAKLSGIMIRASHYTYC